MVRARASSCVRFGALLALGYGALLAGGSNAARAATLSYDHNTVLLIDGAAHDRAGTSVAPAGDVNGDEIPDVLVGAPGAAGRGAAYVVYGVRGLGPARIKLGKLTARQGYKITGSAKGDRTGSSVAALDDLNGDGVPEALVGAPGADSHGKDSGAAYVVFGRRGQTAGPVDLAYLRPADGYRIDGTRKDAYAGSTVRGAGDVNGDGLQDLLVTAPGWQLNVSRAATYILYGRRASAAAPLTTPDSPAADGYPVFNTGDTAAPAGDVNGDGVPDALVGEQGSSYAPRAFVIYGQRSAATTAIDAERLLPTQGYAVDGAFIGVEYGGGTWEGTEVHPLGDMNGDGVPDILTVGGGDPYDRSAGAFVVYGQRSATPMRLRLPQIPLTRGYGMVHTPGGLQETNSNMTPAGDVNHDGLPDVLVGGNRFLSVVFGRSVPLTRTIDLTHLIPSQGYRYRGYFGGDSLETAGELSGVGDMSGDGVPDALLGGSHESLDPTNAGRVRVLALRASPPYWPTVRMAVAGRRLRAGCAARTLRASVVAGGPDEARLTLRLRLDGRTVSTTSHRTAKLRLSARRLRPGHHELQATATALDGTQTSEITDFKVCR